MVQCGDEAGAISFEAAHECQVHRAVAGPSPYQDFRRGLSVRRRSRLKRHFTHVVADIELGVVDPTGQPAVSTGGERASGSVE